jgi:two-component system, cell cycle response regulator DivK
MNLAPKKVLVVEDNELNLKLFNDLLEANNYKVFQNKTGVGVLEFCRADRPDLIIMDIQLPNISGLDLIEQLKMHEDLSKIPVIAVTAFAMQGDKQNILSAGCEEYLSKPISIGIFLETIRKYI